jgi:C4-dicarboxylate transporter DctM subunit
LIFGGLLPTEGIIFLFVPIVFPAAQIAGVDPVHFCVVVPVNLMIGLNTPPFGLSLFVASGALLCVTCIEPIMTFPPSTM